MTRRTTPQDRTEDLQSHNQEAVPTFQGVGGPRLQNRDADLIYNALLRAERRAEAALPKGTNPVTPGLQSAFAVLATLQVIREEIGNGLSKEGR